jgi:hypothetical protein
MRQSYLFLLALLASTLLLGCAAAEPGEWCPPAHAGIEVVASTGAGVWESAGAMPHLVELWRAGGLNEGEELALPIHLAVSPTGRAAVPDFGLGEVVVIEPDGRWAGAWGGKGSGPGELAMPVAAAWGADGRLVVFDVVAPKITFLAEVASVAVGTSAAESMSATERASEAEDRAITPAFTAPVVSSGELLWAGVQPSGAALLQPAHLPLPDEATTRGPASDAAAAPTAERAATSAATGRRLALILRLPPGAAAPDTIARGVVRTIPAGRPFAGWTLPGWPRPVAAVGPGGVLATGGEDGAYRVVIHDDAGRPTRQLCRAAPALPLSPEETGRGTVPEALRDLAAALRDAPAPAALAPYGRIFLDADGRLWVQRERPSPFDAQDAMLGVAGARYDIFDGEGRYLGELRAPPGARLQAALGDTVWAFEVGELDETTVVAYQVEGVGW